MQFFIESYHRNNKILLSLIGQWPYQTVKIRRLIFFILIFLSGTQIIAKFCALWEAMGDIDILIESLSPLMIDITAGAKIINHFLNLGKMKELLDQMQKHVQVQSNFQILQKYAENGRKFTLVYMTALYSALIVFVLMPLQPILFPTPNVTNRPLLHNVEYYVDVEKYYIPILLHGYITVIICVTIVIAVDTMFVILVQHACGLFSIVGYQLEHIITDKTLHSGSNLHIKKDVPYQYMRQCINNHNEAVRFANLIESSYSVSILFQTGLIMVALSITGVQNKCRMVSNVTSDKKTSKYNDNKSSITFHVNSWKYLCFVNGILLCDCAHVIIIFYGLAYNAITNVIL
ncbi:uncharacterized protein [Linepithema humile]|uniref:uncharacterized protein isoform X2 n=1 Tax=Linepithema humile TaxID=83485 RepID=UPI00351E88A8